MAITRAVEVLSRSKKSFADAAQQAISKTARSVRNVKSIYTRNLSTTMENNAITEYRAYLHITFEQE